MVWAEGSLQGRLTISLRTWVRRSE